MPTIVIYGDPADGHISSSAATYANAREGTGTLTVGSSGLNVANIGQTETGGPLAICNQSFMSFDTSVLGALVTINVVLLYLQVEDTAPTAQTFVFEVRNTAWVAPYVASDFVAGSILSTKILVASASSLAINPGYISFSSEPVFLTELNKTGFTNLLVHSDRQRTDNAPVAGVLEGTRFFTANDGAGTNQDPKLQITYASPPPALGGTLGTFKPVIEPPRLTSP